MTVNELINWFYSESFRIFKLDLKQEPLCQCQTEELIEKSDRPDQMRAYLLISVAIDKAIRFLKTKDYSKFRDIYQFPRIESHGSNGECNTEWFIYELYGWHLKMNWELCSTIAGDMLKSIKGWIDSNIPDEDAWELFANNLVWLVIRIKQNDEKAAAVLEHYVNGFPPDSSSSSWFQYGYFDAIRYGTKEGYKASMERRLIQQQLEEEQKKAAIKRKENRLIEAEKKREKSIRARLERNDIIGIIKDKTPVERINFLAEIENHPLRYFSVSFKLIRIWSMSRWAVLNSWFVAGPFLAYWVQP